MKNSGNTLAFRKLQEDKANLKAFLNCPALNVSQRLAIKGHVNTLDDASLGTQTKVNQAKETYSEMKQHKQYAEDAAKTKTILEETQGILERSFATAITLPKLEPIGVSESIQKHNFDTPDEKKGWLSLYFELEGTYLC